MTGWSPPPPRTELIWAAVDLDDTLAEGVWTPESNGRNIGAPIERNVEKLNELVASGMKIVIHTARGWEHYQSIESWLDHHQIPHHRIVCGKLLAAVYVDDRAVESEQESWSRESQKFRQRLALGDYEFYKSLSAEDLF
jgi:hydroxymethylpyrimidine pyrophosphatase-like HAD family hydrolase